MCREERVRLFNGDFYADVKLVSRAFPNWSWQQVKVVSHRFYASVDIANSFIISRCILSGELKFADIRRAMRRKSALNKMP